MIRIGDKVHLKSDKGLFMVISQLKQNKETMYEVTNGNSTFWTNVKNFDMGTVHEQLCLFDFAEEIESIAKSMPSSAKEELKRVYKEGDTFSNGNATIKLIRGGHWCNGDSLSTEITIGDYRMDYAGCFLHFNIQENRYEPVTDDTRFALAAMGFSFSRLEDGKWVNLDGDNMHHIHWLNDPKICALVDEAYKDEWHGDDRYSIRYDIRDLFTMKWLGLESLPKKNLERIEKSCGKRNWKKKPTYYDVDITFGELLKFLKMKEVNA